jgi:hypothetical protein
MEVCHLVPGRESCNPHKPYPARRCLCPFRPRAGCYIATWAARFSPLSRPTRRGATLLRLVRAVIGHRRIGIVHLANHTRRWSCLLTRVGVLHPLHPLHGLFDLATVSATRWGATLLRHAQVIWYSPGISDPRMLNAAPHSQPGPPADPMRY